MDILAVRTAAARALHYIRETGNPYILEMVTYRYRGHSMSDPQKYRSKDEVEGYKNDHDPIEQVRGLLQKQGVSEDQIDEMDAVVKEKIARATQFAQDSPLPDESELWTNVLIPVEGVA
jgi:pyruvate dehydrogenase E1 component alpha subunit